MHALGVEIPAPLPGYLEIVSLTKLCGFTRVYFLPRHWLVLSVSIA